MTLLTTARVRIRPVLAVMTAYAVALQLLLAAFAPPQTLPAVGSDDPFVICLGNPAAPADDHAPADRSLHRQHCVLCSVAAASAAILPAVAGHGFDRPVAVAVSWPTTVIAAATRHFTPRQSQGPPQSA
jgi:hypothetical protein